MTEVINVVKELIKLGLSGVKIEYNENKEMFYYDLNTGAKSGLRLYEDFTLEGRYGYREALNKDQCVNELICDLFYEFKYCLCGRDFYNQEWMEIGVEFGLIEKKVETHMFITYE